MDFDLRPENPADYDSIDQIVTAAFRQPAEASLIRRLRAAGDHLPDLCLV
ncbi:MAG: N-acetyltransferase, partial [Bacteroidetes bacterium]